MVIGGEMSEAKVENVVWGGAAITVSKTPLDDSQPLRDAFNQAMSDPVNWCDHGYPSIVFGNDGGLPKPEKGKAFRCVHCGGTFVAMKVRPPRDHCFECGTTGPKQKKHWTWVRVEMIEVGERAPA